MGVRISVFVLSRLKEAESPKHKCLVCIRERNSFGKQKIKEYIEINPDAGKTGPGLPKMTYNHYTAIRLL